MINSSTHYLVFTPPLYSQMVDKAALKRELKRKRERRAQAQRAVFTTEHSSSGFDNPAANSAGPIAVQREIEREIE